MKIPQEFTVTTGTTTTPPPSLIKAKHHWTKVKWSISEVLTATLSLGTPTEGHCS